MDLAKVLERNEGPGDVQVCYLNYTFLFLAANQLVFDVIIFLLLKMKLLEVEDDLYQKMATYSENDGQ